MIAIDTNILLRYLLSDDAVQTAQAQKIMLRNDLILITDIVLVEAIWCLRGKKYRASKEQIIEVVTLLLREPKITFENKKIIWGALNDYRKSKNADFPDALAIHKAQSIAFFQCLQNRGDLLG